MINWEHVKGEWELLEKSLETANKHFEEGDSFQAAWHLNAAEATFQGLGRHLNDVVKAMELRFEERHGKSYKPGDLVTIVATGESAVVESVNEKMHPPITLVDNDWLFFASDLRPRLAEHA